MADSHYFRRGVTEVWFCTSVAARNAPSASADFTAGNSIRLTSAIAAMNGFTFQNTPITVPTLDDNFDSQIIGVDAAANSDVELYETQASNGVIGSDEANQRTKLTKGNVGYIVIGYAGFSGTAGAPASGNNCEVFPVISSGPARLYTLGNEAAKQRFSFSITSRPATGAAVVA